MRKLTILLLFALLASCEDCEPIPCKGYYYTVIEAGSIQAPVYLLEAPRKLGTPYVFLPSPGNVPELREYPENLTGDNLADQSAELVLVQITIIHTNN